MSNTLDKGYRQTTKVDVRITAPEHNKYSAAPMQMLVAKIQTVRRGTNSMPHHYHLPQ